MIKVHKTMSYQDMSEVAANRLTTLLKSGDMNTLCITSGNTTTKLYELLAQVDDRKLFNNVDVYAMDECIGIDEENLHSNATYFKRYIEGKITVKSFIAPSVDETDIENSDYYKKVKEVNSFDLLILGVGKDGHIAFNMPNSYLKSTYHIEQLNKDYVDALKKKTPLGVSIPKKAVTLGIADIMKAKRILLLASGKNKALAVSKLFDDKITSQYPVSLLKLHPCVELVADEDALSYQETVIEDYGANNYADMVMQELANYQSSINYNTLIEVVNTIVESENNGGRVHITGIGKPSYVAGYIASLLSSTGTAAYLLDGCEAIHGSSGQVKEKDVVIAISNSGETAELKETVKALLNNDAVVIGVSSNENSWLAKSSKYHISAAIQNEGDGLNKPPRASFLAETLVLQTLSVMLQNYKQINMEQYYKWHPGGLIGQSVKKMMDN